MAKRLTKKRSEWRNCNCHLDTAVPCPIHVTAKKALDEIFDIIKSKQTQELKIARCCASCNYFNENTLWCKQQAMFVKSFTICDDDYTANVY